MPPRDRLTGKEVDVAVLVSEDLTNREIACAIGTTEQVVKNYLRPTFDKLGGLEPPGIGALCGGPWRPELARRIRFYRKFGTSRYVNPRI